MDELIAVIVPVYNTEEYLDTCVNSLLAQDYPNLEIILVDDGSTDGSYERCKDFEKMDHRVTALHQENGGILSAKCKGLEHTQARYVTFADSDDWMQPDMYRSLYETMLQYRVDMVVSGIVRVYPDGKHQYDLNSFASGRYGGEQFLVEIIPRMLCSGVFFQWGIDPSTATKLFKKDVIYPIIKKAAEFGFYYGEDTAVVYPYLLQMNSIYIMDQCFYFHRQYENRIDFYTENPEYKKKIGDLYQYLRNIFLRHEQHFVLLRQLEYFYANAIYRLYAKEVRKMAPGFPGLPSASFLFPFEKIRRGSKIILYGAGNVGTVFYRQLMKTSYCSEVIWVDRNYDYYVKCRLPVGAPGIKAEADYYVIAVANKNAAQEIKAFLLNQGVEELKIVMEDPLLRLW